MKDKRQKRRAVRPEVEKTADRRSADTELRMEEGTNKPWELKARLREYALDIIRMYCALPKTEVARVLGHQALRSGTSVGAHQREASRARSRAEFISKMETGLQELEETEYWLDLLAGSGIASESKLNPLIGETRELIAIFTASSRTAKGMGGQP